MGMSIDGPAAMRAISDMHASQMQASMTGPKVDESLSTELGGLLQVHFEINQALYRMERGADCRIRRRHSRNAA